MKKFTVLEAGQHFRVSGKEEIWVKLDNGGTPDLNAVEIHSGRTAGFKPWDEVEVIEIEVDEVLD